VDGSGIEPYFPKIAKRWLFAAQTGPHHFDDCMIILTTAERT
jgi:hypothetical protein